MNEGIFLVQVLAIAAFSLGALKLGKEALTAWIVLQAIIANLFVLKQIVLFGLEVTASDAFVIGSLLGLSFLQEYFGAKEAKKATWICFFGMIFFACISQLHLLYHPSPSDNSQTAFLAILTPTLRLLIASLSVFFVVQQVDIRFFAFLKTLFPLVSFPFRTMIALIFSQLLDTVLFSFAGLYGIVASLFNIILMSFAIKLLVIFFYSSCIKWSKT
jgi:queuosine precursor transporter